MLLLCWEGQGWGQGGSRGPSEEAVSITQRSGDGDSDQGGRSGLDEEGLDSGSVLKVRELDGYVLHIGVIPFSMLLRLKYSW